MEIFGNRRTKKATDSQNANCDPDNEMETQQQTQSESYTREQSYQLTKDRVKRTIRQLKRFGYTDMIAFALAAAQDINVDEGELAQGCTGPS